MKNLTDNNSLDVLVAKHQPENVTLKSYIIGFVSCLFITLCAYFVAQSHALNRPIIILLLVVFALTQFVIQLVYFLHIGREFSPRLKLIVALFMILVVAILVGGSLWIMNNLNGRVMNSAQMQRYMNNQNGL